MPKIGFFLPQAGSDIIKKRLREMNISQEKFAYDYLDITPKTLGNWLGQRTSIDLKKFEAILINLGIGIEDIFSDKLPKEYRSKTNIFFNQNLRALMSSDKIQKLFDKHRKNNQDMLQYVLQHVSFCTIPMKGPFVTIRNDGTKQKCYADIYITTQERFEETIFILSFQLLEVVRVNIGEIIVKRNQVIAKPYFKKNFHIVNRSPQKTATVRIATWFYDEGCLFFIKNKDKISFTAEVRGYLNEEDIENNCHIATFWKDEYMALIL